MPSAEGRTADRSLLVLGGIAVVGVTTLAAFTRTWPPWAYPAAGLIAAAWGARTAAALDTGNHQALPVTARQTVALLSPVWLAALITLPLLEAQAWLDRRAGAGTPSRWRVPLTWLAPVAEPRPGDGGYHELSGRLWLIRALLWLTLLAPALVFCFRKWTRRTAAVVLLLMAAAAAQLYGGQEGLATQIGLSLAVLGGPWLLGVAQQDGRLRSWRLGWVLPAATALIAVFAYHVMRSPDQWDVDLADSPHGLGAAAALTLGVTLLALRLTPPLIGLIGLTGGRPVPRGLAVLDARMVTIYLWSGICGHLIAQVPQQVWGSDAVRAWVQVAATDAGVVAAVMLVGWVEDLGVGRRAQLLPRPARTLAEDRPMRAPDGREVAAHILQPLVFLAGGLAEAHLGRPLLAVVGLGLAVLSGPGYWLHILRGDRASKAPAGLHEANSTTGDAAA